MKSRLLPGCLLLVSLVTVYGNAQPYYNPDIQALINAHGCAECHGGSGGLFVTSYANIMTTGTHGPVVVPFDSNSVIVRKLKGTAGFGDRMPRGGPFLSDAETQVFVQWIMNGALETAPTSVAGTNGTPSAFGLFQNYPNPFNPTTSIRFQVAEAADVNLAVYDHLGREVAVLIDGRMDAGDYDARFDASGLASGVYLYRLKAGAYAETKKMTILR